MTHLFLTSSVHAVAHDIAKKVDFTQGNKLVFIDTAAEPEEGDKQWLLDDRQALVDAGFKVSDYTITGKSKKELEKDLKPFDHIYVSGGDTLYLLDQSQKSSFFSLVKDLINNQGKVYIGTSAGSIIAGPFVPDYLENSSVKLGSLEGFNFVNFVILPHWGSPFFKEIYLGGRLDFYYKDTQAPLLILTDTQYIEVNGESMKIIETSK